MDIAAAAQKIIDRTHSMKPGAASIFLAENIRFHQDLCRKIAAKSAKPKGWTLAGHLELIQTLISAQSDLHTRVAA